MTCVCATRVNIDTLSLVHVHVARFCLELYDALIIADILALARLHSVTDYFVHVFSIHAFTTDMLVGYLVLHDYVK